MDGGIYGGGTAVTAPPAKKLNVMRGRSHHSSSLRPLSQTSGTWAGMEQNGTKWNNLVFCRRPKARTNANATNKQCPGYKVKLVFAEQKKPEPYNRNALCTYVTMYVCLRQPDDRERAKLQSLLRRETVRRALFSVAPIFLLAMRGMTCAYEFVHATCPQNEMRQKNGKE